MAEKKPMQIIMDPRMLEDIKDDPELIAGLEKAKRLFETAAQMAGPGATEAQLNAALEKLGGRVGRVDIRELPEDEQQKIMERLLNPVSRH